MKRLLLTVTLLAFTLTSFSQKKESHVIYNSKGKKVSYKKMLKTIAKKEVILFGESHDNPISHWLQFEVTSDLNKTNQLILGAEMFEADNQDILNEYLKDSINSKELDSLARLWPNYKTDYAPLVDFAKENKLPFIATNIPRRYARMVNKNGFKVLDTLSPKEKTWMAPLPMPFDSELTTYKDILKSMGDHGTPELVMAQATKDATMAYFILKNYRKGYTFLHYNGSYHSDDYEGILWYIKRERPKINYATISTVSQENVNKLLEENKNKADFIICVDSNMTNTY
ncbi:MAG: ChaN family lipoprotein [Flavobacteriaceae bacterium]|nr:ChaN family lipoprotein [Flavobacteriaceae bacterium]